MQAKITSFWEWQQHVLDEKTCGLLQPCSFIPEADNTGQMNDLAQTSLLWKACNQIDYQPF